MAQVTPFFLVLMIGFVIFDAGGSAGSVVQHRLRDYLAATHMLKAQGTWSEEESVPRHGWFKRLSDLTLFPEQVKCHHCAGFLRFKF
ncbi:hypothetical protein [Pantoea agglomerans]